MLPARRALLSVSDKTGLAELARGLAGLGIEVVSTGGTLAHLREAAARFSHHWGLNQLLVEWLAEEPLAQQEQAVRHLLAIGPDAAWAQRELASSRCPVWRRCPRPGPVHRH